ncbi:hypothetical protein JCM21900_003897 [Sporobolomyces salmonicolor]
MSTMTQGPSYCLPSSVSSSSSASHSRTRSFHPSSPSTTAIPMAAPLGPAPSASLLASSPSTSSYTLSLPSTYRRSSFPVSPALPLGAPPGRVPAYTLPPGLGLELRGCRDDDDYERATGTRAPLFDRAVASSSAARKSSVSSEASSSTADPIGSSSAPLSSLASSILSDQGGGPAAPWLAASGRSWSLNSGMDKAKREAVKGWEDPALAAARRALWDDVPEETKEELQEGRQALQVFVEDDEEEGAQDEFEDSDDDHDDWSLFPPRSPAHATLTPGPSCLRNRGSPSSAWLSLSTSFSSSSQSSSAFGDRGVSPSSSQTSHTSIHSHDSPSLRFSDDPPLTCPTYSAEDYERKGEGPVEKLSIREWIELQGVREAVGVWSGKIGKWDEDETGEGRTTGAGASVVVDSNSTSMSNKGRTQFPLAAVVGVVHVSRSTPSSPVAHSIPLHDHSS